MSEVEERLAPSEGEVRVMLAIILAQPELNGAIKYSALQAGLKVYEEVRGQPELWTRPWP
jgi:hypothetical protein